MHTQLKMISGKYLHTLVNNQDLENAYQAKGLQLGDEFEVIQTQW